MRIVLLLSALFALLFPHSGWAKDGEEPLLLIRNARIFEGNGAPAYSGDVLIRGETIEEVARQIRRPRGAQVIDAQGMTIMPGLHDLHTHLRAPAYYAPEDMGKAWASHLVHGVTTVNDYSLSGEMIEAVRELTRQPGGIWAPHLNLAVRTGVQGGHGTVYGWGAFFTMTAETPREAKLVADRALAYRPNVVKVFADGWRYGRDPDLNSINLETLSTLTKEVQLRGVPVVTHTVTLQGAKNAATAGVNALVHGTGDALVDDELVALMKAHETGYVSTMVAYEPQEDRVLSAEELATLSPPELRQEQAHVDAGPRQVAEYDAKRWEILKQNLQRFYDEDVLIGIGTDAGIGGIYHGSSVIREMEWMVKLGITPTRALVAATQSSSRIMGKGGTHGTIMPGSRADLLLIDGKPDENIGDIRNISRVWLAGREVPLDELRARLASDEMTPLPVHPMPGPIYSGTRQDGRTDLDTLIVDATDEGADHSHIDIVHTPADAQGHRAIFTVAGFGASNRPFAGAVFPLTRGAVELADASAFSGVALTVKGAGKYRLVLESYGLTEGADFRASFTAGDGMQEIRIPFTEFASPRASAVLDLARLRAVRVDLLGEPESNGWLEINAIRFY